MREPRSPTSQRKQQNMTLSIAISFAILRLASAYRDQGALKSCRRNGAIVNIKGQGIRMHSQRVCRSGDTCEFSMPAQRSRLYALHSRCRVTSGKASDQALGSAVSLSGAPNRAHRRLLRTLVLAFAAFAGGATVVSADESGISFWVPGTYGPLAAAPLPQGFSIAEIYYHSPIKGGGDIAIARQIPVAGVTTKVSATLDIHIGVQNDL